MKYFGASDQAAIAKQKVEGGQASLASILKKEKIKADVLSIKINKPKILSLRDQLEALEMENAGYSNGFTILDGDMNYILNQKEAREKKIRKLRIEIANALIKELKANKELATDEEIVEAINYQQQIIADNTDSSDVTIISSGEVVSAVPTVETSVDHPLANVLKRIGL